ncbi:MAG: Rieske (2Fe-2S) protein [Cyclobacteriaceae bacterium]
MIIRKASFLFLLFSLGCEPQLVDDPIPIVSFNEIVINLSFPEYIVLRNDKGFKELPEGGVRGIIIYHAGGTTYHAYERNCSYRPNEACATVNVHSSGLFMTDPCCGSNFNFEDGSPSGGAAWRPLRKYRTQLNGDLLTITDEILD